MQKLEFKTANVHLIAVFLIILLFVLSVVFPLTEPAKWLIIIIIILLFLSVAFWWESSLNKYQVENQKVNSDLNKAIFEMMALFEFTNVLGSNLNLTQMLESIVDMIKRIHNYDGCCLFFYDEQSQSLLPQVSRGFSMPTKKNGFPINELPGGSLLKSGQAVIINNIDEEYPNFKNNDSNFRRFLGEFSSFVFLPLMVDERLIGLLLLAKYTAAAYAQEDLRLLLIIASQAGLTIQNRRLYEQAYYSAITDGLTGIYNQKYFREQLELQLENAKEYGFKISLILIDIDHFKKFNDTYGHLIGDKVLKEVSKVIQDCVNPDNLVARYGGEEFVVILPDTDTDAAVIIGEKIRSTIEKHVIKTSEYPSLKVTVSLGIATFPDHIKNMRRMVVELIDIADDSLYLAKNSGRNRVCVPQ